MDRGFDEFLALLGVTPTAAAVNPIAYGSPLVIYKRIGVIGDVSAMERLGLGVWQSGADLLVEAA